VKKLLLTPIIAVCTIALSSCATDVANRYYASTTYPEKKPDQVQVLRQAPSQPYEVIADFQSRGDSIKSVRNKAAKIGADAVIISTLGGYYERAEEWASGDAQSNTYSRICGTAIRYTQQKPKKQ
jgi:uncharacterized protein YbjQ (UPF0145 family)